jgi:hypothetical protein
MRRSRLRQHHGVACSRAQLRADYFAVSKKLERRLDFAEFASRWRNVAPIIEQIAPGREARLRILTSLSESVQIRRADPAPPLVPPEVETFARQVFGDDTLDRLLVIQTTLRTLLERKRARTLERVRAMRMAADIWMSAQNERRDGD